MASLVGTSAEWAARPALFGVGRTVEDPRRRATRDVLLRALSPLSSRVEAPEDLDWDYLLERARAHKVASLVASKLELGSGHRAASELAKAADLGVRRAREGAATLRIADAVLRRAAVDFVVLKGPDLAARSYANPALRPFSDLDLLVRPEAIETAKEALGRAGYVQQPTWTKPHEIGMVSPIGTFLPIDLHTAIRPPHEASIPTAELFAGSEPAVLLGTNVRVLSPTAGLVHVALHAVGTGPHGFYLLHAADVAHRLVFGPVANADELDELTKRHRLSPGLAGAFALIARLTGVAPERLRIRTTPGLLTILRLVSSAGALVDQALPPERWRRLLEEIAGRACWEVSLRRAPVRSLGEVRRALRLRAHPTGGAP